MRSFTYVGLTTTDHPVLAAAVPSPDTDRLTLTGSLKTTDHPWLNEHIRGHTILLDSVREGHETVLPFAWHGMVRLHRAASSSLRMRITSTGPDTVAVTLADQAGHPVLTVDRTASLCPTAYGRTWPRSFNWSNAGCGRRGTSTRAWLSSPTMQ